MVVAFAGSIGTQKTDDLPSFSTSKEMLSTAILRVRIAW